MVHVNRTDFLVRIYISQTGPTEVDFAFLQICGATVAISTGTALEDSILATQFPLFPKIRLI